MTSPLSMLKKTKRTPLLGEHRNKQKAPLRRNLLQEFQASSATKDSSEKHPPSSSHTSANNPSALCSDFELMAIAMKRVALLEKTVKSQAEEIKRRDKKISALEGQLRNQAESGNKRCAKDDLERKCQALQTQVQEMETFLGDYGLIWVGDNANSSKDEWRSDSNRNPQQQDGGGFQMNFDLVLRSIHDINILAGQGESFVQTTATGARLAQREPIQLSLYSNGIVMFEGPFRSYKEPSTQLCMEDLMEGYFPSELHDRFPDGAPFEVHDRREEEFVFNLPWERFPGEGQAVKSGKTNASSGVNFLQPGNEPTTEQFLKKLPKMVVKEGRVIDIRKSLQAMMQGSTDTWSSSSSVVLVDTPALQAGTERPPESTGGQQNSESNITLKVRSEDGNHTFILKMYLSETVDHLRKYLEKHRGEGLSGYDIISAYPKQCYNNGAHTLQLYGLTSNTSLLLRKKQ